jgi:general secretion pathway protein G
MKRLNGFTLVELLVVVSLIGVLATLILANLNAARERARDAQRKSDLRNIQTALRLYYNDNNAYAPAAEISAAWGTTWSKNGVTYMNVLPKDPLSPTQDYVYTYVDTDNYTLMACLENKSDSKCVTVLSGVCASTCKYEVSP